MKKITLGTIGLLFLFSSPVFCGDTQPNAGDKSIIELNILKVKERLKDKLLSTADAVIQKHVKAIGGVAAIKSIQTMMVKARSISLNRLERPLLRYYKQPGYFKQQTPGSLDFMSIDKQKVYYVRNGKKMEMKQSWTKTFRSQRIDGNFLDYDKRSITYEYMGLMGLDTEPTVFYQLKRTFKDGYYEYLFFDVDSGLLRMIGFKDYPDSYQMLYQYREIGGIRFPMISMRVFNRLTPPHVFIIDDVKFNESYKDSFFGISDDK